MATQTIHYNFVKPEYTDPADIGVINDNMDDIDAELYARAKSVNGQTVDATGNIDLNTVPFAADLKSDAAQQVTGVFLERMTGGDASVGTGEARLTVVKGNRVHTGFTPESISVDVSASGDPPFTIEFDRDTFVENVSSSGTIVLQFTTVWDSDPADFGITITGTPVNGDSITIVYVAEVRGTITHSNPQSFGATGYNLYNHTVGYAIGKKYSDDYGYMIDGTYTSVQFSTTINGSRTTITPDNKQFNIPSDGYIWVNGGNGTDTEIFATWSDWTSGRPGDFAAYSESVIDLSGIMSASFPLGLMQVGDYRDEINFTAGETVSYIDRMEYSAENLADAKESGREYEYDENYIYIVRATAIHSSLSISNIYTANDHGLEFFTDSDVAVYAGTVYGASLKNKLERDVLTISQQSLSASQKAQVRQNIGATWSDLIVVKEYGCTASVSANSYTSVSFSDLSVDDMTGYNALGVVWAGFDAVPSEVVYPYGSEPSVDVVYTARPQNFDDVGSMSSEDKAMLAAVWLHNHTSIAKNNKRLTVRVAYIRNDTEA